MKQTRLESLLEVNLNIALGFFVSLLFWTFFIVPVYDIPVSFVQNLEITGWFTVLAVARGYIMRRFFNAGLHKAVRNIVKGVCTKIGS